MFIDVQEVAKKTIRTSSCLSMALFIYFIFQLQYKYCDINPVKPWMLCCSASCLQPTGDRYVVRVLVL